MINIFASFETFEAFAVNLNPLLPSLPDILFFLPPPYGVVRLLIVFSPLTCYNIIERGKTARTLLLLQPAGSAQLNGSLHQIDFCAILSSGWLLFNPFHHLDRLRADDQHRPTNPEVLMSPTTRWIPFTAAFITAIFLVFIIICLIAPPFFVKAASSASAAAPPPLHLIVNSNLDDTDGICSVSPGDCTLREAILAANASAESVVIGFDLPLGSRTIALTSALPSLTGGDTTIDGYSQRARIQPPIQLRRSF